MMPTDSSDVSLALDFEEYVYLDGSNVPRTATVTNSGNIYTISMPAFSSYAWYDPTVSAPVASGASAAAPKGSIALVALAMCAALAARVLA
jgi:hypothetical protein